MMSPRLQNDQRRNAPSKSCSVAGCGGTMTFQRGQGEPDAAQALEGSSGAAWVCDNDPTHVEVVTRAEE